MTLSSEMPNESASLRAEVCGYLKAIRANLIKNGDIWFSGLLFGRQVVSSSSNL
jgi:hypothetical protein